MRPVISTIGTHNYSLSKWLVPKLSALCVNQYTCKDSFSFAEELSSQTNNNYVMASFDIKSLYTNVPLSETCEIIIDKLFPTPDFVYEGFSRKLFSKVLKNCAHNNIFLFDSKLFLQADGAPMGGCLSPTMANAFLCNHEEMWLNDCPIDFKLVLYKRYTRFCSKNLKM